MSASHAVNRYRHAADFLADVGPWLMQKEDENNLIIALAQVLKTDDHPFREPIYFAAVKDGDAIIGCAVGAHPDGLEVTDLSPGLATSLVPSVAELRPELPWIGGPRLAALEFARAWTQARGGEWRVRHDWMEFRLDEVVPPRPVAGRLRLAESDDSPLVRGWAPGYAAATNSPVDVSGFFERRLRRKELYLWDHDGPKSAIAISGNTPNGVQVAAVYTPEPFRGRGYASNAVAAVSRRALDAGAAFCVLFADREPAAPARIYRALGYRPIREHLMIELVR